MRTPFWKRESSRDRERMAFHLLLKGPAFYKQVGPPRGPVMLAVICPLNVASDSMTMAPTDYRTWTSFADHPIFGPTKSAIGDWSSDPSQYGDLSSYSDFMPEWYVHVDPAPPASEQRAVAARDLQNLRNACRRIIETYGATSHELVILEDFTVFVWLKNPRFEIILYPMLGLEEFMLMLFIETPVSMDELRCDTIDDLLNHLSINIGT